MSNTTIGITDIVLENVTITSDSPTDTSTVEDGSTTYTYSYDAQSYEFRVRGLTTTDAEYAIFSAKMEQLSNADTFKFELGTYGTDIMPRFFNISNNLYVKGAHSAGTSVIAIESTDSNPSGVIPNGTLDVGDLVKFDGATYDKLYRIVSVDSVANTYTVFPSLRQSISNDTRILYGDDVYVRVRMGRDTFKFSQNGRTPNFRRFTITMIEDYTSTT